MSRSYFLVKIDEDKINFILYTSSNIISHTYSFNVNSEPINITNLCNVTSELTGEKPLLRLEFYPGVSYNYLTMNRYIESGMMKKSPTSILSENRDSISISLGKAIFAVCKGSYHEVVKTIHLDGNKIKVFAKLITSSYIKIYFYRDEINPLYEVHAYSNGCLYPSLLQGKYKLIVHNNLYEISNSVLDEVENLLRLIEW